MYSIDGDTVARVADDRALISALRDAFAAGCEMPVRHHHTISAPGDADGTLLIMPAWRVGECIGVKVATVFPGAAERGLPSVSATYLLMDATTGALLAVIDGGELTARRTAAASVLAASYLAREDAQALLVVGTGQIARHLVRAYCSARPGVRRVSVWGRDPDKTAAFADLMSRTTGVPAAAVADLRQAVASADIVSCATLSQTPLIAGAWLSPGTHLDLVGGFTPSMREADDEAVTRARVFVDTRDGCLKEAGDIVQPLQAGRIKAADIADLFDLCRGTATGRRSAEEITLFKSVGAAIEDLAAAQLIFRRASAA